MDREEPMTEEWLLELGFSERESEDADKRTQWSRLWGMYLPGHHVAEVRCYRKSGKLSSVDWAVFSTSTYGSTGSFRWPLRKAIPSKFQVLRLLSLVCPSHFKDPADEELEQLKESRT